LIVFSEIGVVGDRGVGGRCRDSHPNGDHCFGVRLEQAAICEIRRL
jgi:hypothetical protein